VVDDTVCVDGRIYSLLSLRDTIMDYLLRILIILAWIAILICSSVLAFSTVLLAAVFVGVMSIVIFIKDTTLH
jgi:hypothetical protein